MELFAACAPGLEPILAGELASLGLRRAEPYFKTPARSGGLEFAGDLDALYRANLLSRVADRVLVRVARFRAATFAELEGGVRRVPWEKTLAAGSLEVRAECRGSKLYHERGVAERVAKAASQRLGAARAGAAPQRVEVRVEKDVCEISLDSSGEPLSRRGYRLATAKAPLRESLAAALVLASGWDRKSAFIDPFCGSGTIAIEAASIARGLAPGRRRRFAFMTWRDFDAASWTRLVAASEPPASAPPRVLASDRDAGALEAAKANAERAGVGGAIEFSCRAVSAAELPRGPGWIVTNPPYGVRVSEGRDLRALYAQFGKVLSGAPDWTATMLCPNAALARATGMDFGAGLSVMNGGLDVRLFQRRPA